MGLTVETEQSLEAAGLVAFYVQNASVWNTSVQNAYKYVKSTFPSGATIRPDDVAKVLVPVIEVMDELRSKLDEKKLRQKYWVNRFADLIIERHWVIVTRGD